MASPGKLKKKKKVPKSWGVPEHCCLHHDFFITSADEIPVYGTRTVMQHVIKYCEANADLPPTCGTVGVQ